MARPIKETPILTKSKDIQRVLNAIKNPRAVSKKEDEKAMQAYNFLESIRQF
ncbi:MAG: hypothetical protein JKX79_11215 [Labilibaculum sp.]|nr:hypothetical protein [Labilibaculum sp.]